MDKRARKLSLAIFFSPIIIVIITVITIYISIFIILSKHFELQKRHIQENFFKQLEITTKERVNIAYNILKTVYIKKCKDKNLSKEECKKRVFKEIVPIFDNLRWSHKGYIFVLDFYGNTLYHPDHSLMKINRWNLVRNGIKVFQLLVNSAKAHPNGTYVKYLGYNFHKQPIWKVSYVKVFKPFDCLVGSGVYLDALDERLLKLKKEEDYVFDKLKNTLELIGLIIFFVALVIAILLAALVQHLFLKYENQIQKEKQRLKRRIFIDSLTGLFNRNYLSYGFNILKSIADKKSQKIAVIFIDLDFFKEVNDTLGHKYGDILLKKVAKRIKSVLRKDDILVRFGGDEFLLFVSFKTMNEVIELINNIYRVIKKEIKLKDKEVNIGATIGISIYPDDSKELDDLIKFSDMAMYEVKKTTKGSFGFYKKELGERIKEKIELHKDLIKAIENEEFEIYFQPKIYKDETLYGSEVLVRWNHPKKGLLTPDKFLPLAYEKKLIKDIDFIILKKAISQYIKWQKLGYEPRKMSCNITMIDIKDKHFIEKVDALLNNSEFDTSNLILEVTEESVMENPEESIKYLSCFRNLKIGISVDDFGTGYSSLSYLKRLPITELKIDRMFVKDIEYSEDDKEIVKIIIALGKVLNLNIVAEGVENNYQKEFLIKEGADIIQGYLYSPPIPAKEFEEKFLKDKKWQ